MLREILNFSDIISHYDGFLFDAYGVLVDDSAAIPGAVDVWSTLQKQSKPTWIVTNGSSRTLSEAVASYRQKGLEVRDDQVISSAALLKPYFLEKELVGKSTAVLGTAGSEAFAREAGAHLVNPLEEDFEVLIVANQTEYPFVPTLDMVISRILRAHREGRACELILTNPDFIYPKNTWQFGITAGSVALLIEGALAACLGAKAPRFERLGKPFPRIFKEAIRRAGTKKLLMVGDQLETDIRGAEAVGIDSLLVGTGLINLDKLSLSPSDPKPNFILRRWGS